MAANQTWLHKRGDTLRLHTRSFTFSFIKCMIKLFAYDTSLYIEVDNPDTSAVLLNNDLDQINKWSGQWLISFNPAKSECLTLSNKVKKPVHPSLIFDNIHEVESH